mmetsp:Transcript_4698/g.11268  ORF Transcript_4698/g.11268 Transcript_4698/m.11268 type:complete len:156 (+) Transcript_4698:248-715(+)
MASGPPTGASRSAKRLKKEYDDIVKAGTFPTHVTGDISHEWIVTMKGADGTLYRGEQFRLRFIFTADYPIEAPEVVFVDPVPVHPHIYSNGHICLSILYDQWSPALRVDSVCMSILSMLSSADGKARPPDNDSYVSRVGSRSPKQTRWDFHDTKA